MPALLSVDVRWRIGWMYEYEGASYDCIADVLGVSPSTACIIVSLYRVTMHFRMISNMNQIVSLDDRRKNWSWNGSWNTQGFI